MPVVLTKVCLVFQLVWAWNQENYPIGYKFSRWLSLQSQLALGKESMQQKIRYFQRRVDATQIHFGKQSVTTERTGFSVHTLLVLRSMQCSLQQPGLAQHSGQSSLPCSDAQAQPEVDLSWLFFCLEQLSHPGSASRSSLHASMPSA